MILVSGSLAYDRIMNFPGYFRDHLLPEKLHQISVSFLIDAITQHFGGTAGNIAYSLALLGEKPVVIGSVGSDYTMYRTWQRKQGIDLSLVQTVKSEQTASAYIMTDKADNQITGFHPGALWHPSIQHSAFSIQSLKKVKMAIVSPGNNDDMRALPKFCKKNNIPYIYDPGQEIPRLSSNDLTRGMTGAKVLMVNDYELAMVQKKTGFTRKQLLDKVDILVTTLGADGSRIDTRSSSVSIPAAKPKKIVDPTGAGDAYRAGFIFGLLQKWPLERVGRLASLTAAYTVEKAGTQTHHFTWNELQKRYYKNFKETLS